MTSNDKVKVGSVLVVGGGIAGVQAALDLADNGFYVYLVEGSSAIGGKMAQLDKTFPTNDCSMCTLSPKLVEVGRHMNIDLITGGEVTRIEGSKGNFQVQIHKTPRYIDESKCTGCGECAEVCPIEFPSEYDMNLSNRKAIFRLYAQAIPGAFAISKKGTAPCKAACPAHVGVQGFIALTNQKKYREALELFKKDHPFPGVCGRVCNHPCEDSCTRNLVDTSLGIMHIHRFLADTDRDSESPYVPAKKADREEKVAIAGAGPAGLTCAYFLAIEGYKVTVFEKLPVLGGMLTVGIPSYRLPREITEAEIKVIKDLGVEFKIGVEIGSDFTIGQLRDEGYKAFFIGIGSQDCKRLNIEGEDYKGVYPGVEFLREVNLGKEIPLGDRVAVIGGGNVAMDAVRTALRKGSKKPFIIYRRAVEQMPANPEEIEECREEGIELMTLSNPTRIMAENGRVKAIECIRMKLGPPDESGRQRPFPIDGSEFIIEVDAVIPAIGQETDWTCLTDECACTVSDRGTMEVDKLTLQTSDPDIFSGGDAVTGPATVVEAISAGKEAAISIDRFIRGEDLYADRKKDWTPVQDVQTEGVSHIDRHPMKMLEPESRINNFNEVQLGFKEDSAQAEAKRCLECGGCCECYQCVAACEADAVTIKTHNQKPEDVELSVGSVVMAPGIELFNPTSFDAYGYKEFTDVITSMEFERILSASGPYGGHMIRPSDQKEPKKIAWIQCVGSRDEHHGNAYCSSVCCTYAIKEAMIAKEHSKEPLDAAIFYIDIRTQGKDFEKYYIRARDEAGVRFIKSKVSRVSSNGNGDLSLRYFDGAGKIIEEDFDMVVLSIGLKPKEKAYDIAEKCCIEIDNYGFASTTCIRPVESSRPGVYVCGAFKGPKDIPESVMEAYATVGACCSTLKDVRNTQIKEKIYPAEKDVSGGVPRIGVFVCHCGNNIGAVVDVPSVRDYAKKLRYVVHAENNLFTCSQDTQEKIKEAVKKYKLNRLVVASCSPRTHEFLFRETLREAGLNKYLFEMANIRDQCSWVHNQEPDKATDKAKDLVRMAVAKASKLEPLKEIKIGVTQTGLVIGGGIAGMTAALELAEQGFSVHLLERNKELGGNARYLDRTWTGENIPEFTKEIVEQVKSHPLIDLHFESVVSEAEGVVGNFKSVIKSKESSETVEHGVVIITTGAQQLQPEEYEYGKHDMVFLSLEFEQILSENPDKFKTAGCAVFIQCVGSRENERPYCSKVCCTQSIQNAIRLKKLNSNMNIYILYRDIRTYGQREALYREARSLGVTFIRYSVEEKPDVEAMENGLRVTVMDQDLGISLRIDSNLLVLASAIIPNDSAVVARQYKTSINQDNFFQEAHVKLRPVDSSKDGVFIAGLCHCPKPIEEAIAQAKAASARAAGVLSKDILEIEPIVSIVDQEKCSGCGTCERVCPWDAIHLVEIEEKMIAQTDTASCKGCGVCAASCPSKAVDMCHFRQEQIREQISAFTDNERLQSNYIMAN